MTQAQALVTDGVASYYGDRFNGRRTASGERFDQGELTAAHRTLEFGTRVLVTNKVNGRSVEVTINDRGPHARGRTIDLSKEAAREIGMLGHGVAPVELRVLGLGDSTPTPSGSNDLAVAQAQRLLIDLF
ncbi:MAG: septal ring lytic transglycosylase RlpA family protein [Chromatiales bacterium]|nr:septal ring lytic transglycosylase RlpA family protein [Chromatiales bacterium]